MKPNHCGPDARALSDDSQSMGSFALDPLHKYTIFGLREGGMGLVYLLKASDPRKKAFTYESVLYNSPELQGRYRYVHRSHLAAKTIRSPQDNEAFLRELNIWITFDDPGCVPLLVIVPQEDSLYGVMPYYRKSLRDVLLNGSYDPRVVMKSMLTAIECLRNVQAKGVIHLDLKPENLLAEDQSGRLLVSDWGIANVKASCIKRSGVAAANRFPALIGVGTVPYMSPERLLHAKPDHRSDIFSLGIILYEILYGIPPYVQDLDLPTQIVSQSYYERASDVLSGLGHKRLSELVLAMIHPEPTRRTSDYDQVLKIVKSI